MRSWVAALLICLGCGAPTTPKTPEPLTAQVAQEELAKAYARLDVAVVECGPRPTCRAARELALSLLFRAYQDIRLWGELGVEHEFRALLDQVDDLLLEMRRPD